MGASKSRALLAEVKAARAVGTHASRQPVEHEKIDNDLHSELEAHKKEFEQKYFDLQLKHAALQDRFLDLKSKLESDELSSGDFTNRASELSRKLNEALSERDFIKLDAQKQIEALLSSQKKFEDEDGSRDLRLKLKENEATCEETIQCLEIEAQDVLNEAAQINQVQGMSEESDGMHTKVKMNQMEIEQKYFQEGLLLQIQHEEEKAELNKQWELKLNEVLQNCNEEANKLRVTLLQENSNLQEKLTSALNDINSLSRKYKLLNNLFEEIRTRYERRESRKEDLERIADLEGQLIIQSEEIERQRYILKSLKFSAPQANNEANSRRNRRSAKRRRQTLNLTSNGNDAYEVNMKPAQRCHVSLSSSGFSPSEIKADI